MGGVQSNVTQLTGIPRFKDDAVQPWVTKEGLIQVSIWMQPNSTMTLEDVARLIEQYATNLTSQQLHHAGNANALAAPAANNTTYTGVVNNMTFRGQTFDRSQLIKCTAVEYMKDGENFGFIMTQTFQTCCVVS